MRPATLALVLALGPTTPGSAPLSAAHTSQVEGSVLGQVLDGDTGEPLVGARVSVARLDVSVLTAADGSFILRNVPTGPQQISFLHGCYHAVSVFVTLGEDSGEEPIALRLSLPVNRLLAPSSCYVQWLRPS